MKLRGVILGVILVIGVFLVVLTQKDRAPQARRAIVDLEAPGFVLLDSSGATVKLSQFKGKTVFLHFWASWCPNCREELPSIQALYNRRKSDPDFVFLSIVYRENPAKSMKYLKANNYDIPLYTDPGEKAARTYGVTGVPETFIIDADGILRKRVIGAGDWSGY
ncbi:Cytochrome c-type biogenesis protein CcmG/DsbE, thiol:disulfide oxidoreductase [hydrothermal vent metagenome]|uniref:Cytochrome c-type biogenesis protein CcmG/DsbE, thiol:disulfide oxidoreductase n=1 Tax=hydrothermal vent metagenome TaxID=652676 RepID=A0A3B1CYJ5_9ZZZZ